MDQRHKRNEWTPETLVVLRKNIFYDSNTGVFRWIINKAWKKAGERAGCIDPITGYRFICVDRKKYYEHYLAIMFSGQIMPPGMQADHINGNRSDNRLSNLRVVTPSENGHNRTKLNKNNTSGVIGVHFDKSRGKFAASISVDYKTIFLGRFKTYEDAVQARNTAHQNLREVT